MALTIVIGNRNDSSWSLRGWLALRMSGAAFDEMITCATPGATIVYTTDGSVPTLASSWPAPARCSCGMRCSAQQRFS